MNLDPSTEQKTATTASAITSEAVVVIKRKNAAITRNKDSLLVVKHTYIRIKENIKYTVITILLFCHYCFNRNASII